MDEEFVAQQREDTKITRVSQRDNSFLNEEALESFENSVTMSEDEREARRHGKFGFLSHIAFPTFDPEVHVVKATTQDIPSHWPRICACDPAHRRPFFFLWLAVNPQGNIYHVYDEYPCGENYMQIRSSGLAVKDYATLIRNKEGSRPAHMRVIDPRFGKASWTVKGQSTTSIVEDFQEFGLTFLTDIEGTDRIETGLSRVRNLLAFDKGLPIDARNHPKLVIHDNCQNLITAMRTWSFVPPDQRDDQLLKEAVVEAWTDPIDTLRYAILSPIPQPQSHQPKYIKDQDLGRMNNPRRYKRFGR